MNLTWDLKLAVIVVLVLAIAYLGRADLGRYISPSHPPAGVSCPWLPTVTAHGCGQSLTLTGSTP